MVGFDVAVVDLAQPMKILCVIDSLGSGGAQRQMVNLARGFKSKGYDVEMLIYYPQLNFFRPEVEKAGGRIHEKKKKKRVFFEGCRENPVFDQIESILRNY